MRGILVLAIALGGCGDDSAAGASGDLSAPTNGGDLGVGDLGCGTRAFLGFVGANLDFQSFDCSCGCIIDSFDNNFLSSNWGASTTSGAVFKPSRGAGLGVALTTSGGLETGGLASEGPNARFYVDGDFDLLVDYDLGATPPPGESHLVLGVRPSGTINGTEIYEVQRHHAADGSDTNETVLGGVSKIGPAITATQGTLRLARSGTTLSSYADGQVVSMRIGEQVRRLMVTLAATLEGCSEGDAGGSCSYTPRWHRLRMQSGQLVNQP
jgi:hypothetical protein